jgi:hypothetical protein
MLLLCVPVAVDAMMSATGYTEIAALFWNICKIDK